MADELEYPLSNLNLSAHGLSDAVSTMLGTPVTVAFITPGQVDVNGSPIAPMIWATDNATGDRVVLDPTKLDDLMNSYVPPPPTPTRDDHLSAVAAKAAGGDLPGAFTDLCVLLRSS